MNNAQTQAKKALLAFAKAQGHNVRSIRHIHSHAFFVGYCAPASAIFKQNYLDSEPQVKDFTKKYPYTVITNFGSNAYFDTALKEGDACYTGYMNTDTSGIIIACAIPIDYERT